AAAFSGSPDYNASATVLANFTINRATLNVTAVGGSKVYDQGTGASVTLSVTPLPGDSVSATFGSASFLDKNAGTGKPISVTGITLFGTNAGNYTSNSN